jgi:hypothetical protein
LRGLETFLTLCFLSKGWPFAGLGLTKPRRFRHGQSLCIGVGNDEFRALQLLCDHVVHSYSAATANNSDLWL